jgi:hypothetical protein
MRLEDVTAEIRPRQPWESVDLGCAMLRRHLPSLTKLWLILVLPLWLIIALTLHNHTFWLLTGIWLTKPWMDVVTLFHLSRVLFGVTPSLRDVAKGSFAYAMRDFFHLFLWTRLPGVLLIACWFFPEPALIAFVFMVSAILVFTMGSVSRRAFLIPIRMLEGLKGSAYKKRNLSLGRIHGGIASWTFYTASFFEGLIWIGMIWYMMDFLPESMTEPFLLFQEFFAMEGFFLPEWFSWFMIGGYMVAVGIAELLYAGACFGLYLGARTDTEGWDIELMFRRIGKRLSGGLVSLVLFATIFLTPSLPAQNVELEIAPPPEKTTFTQEKEIVTDVLASPDFQEHTRTVKRLKWETNSTPRNAAPPNPGNWQAIYLLIRTLGWITLAALVVWLIWLIYKNGWKFWQGRQRLDDTADTRKAPTSVMGLSLEEKSLPGDIPSAALAALRQGHTKEAVSILYRGALFSMVHQGVPIEESNTEGECLGHSCALPDHSQQSWFAGLTQNWIAVAYGKNPPPIPVIEQLCSTYPFRSRAK